jgi:eukaryotic-like serine/threonine-protein kinase
VTPERWERVDGVFRHLLERTPSEREGAIEELCGGDRELRREVISLLRSHDEAGSFLDEPVVPAFALNAALSEGEADADADADVHMFVPEELVSGRFRIVRFIAEGGMGEVYEAWDTVLAESVALKTIRPIYSSDEEAEERFMREIQLARRVTHPNVCRTYDVFHHQVSPDGSGSTVRLLSMELLSQETLGRRLRRSGALPVARALPLLRQIAEALRAAHDVGVVHRDLKPDNVILVPRKKGHRAVVTDFGLARGGNVSVSTSGTTSASTSSNIPGAATRGDLLWTLHGFQAGVRLPATGPLSWIRDRALERMVAFGFLKAPRALTEAGRVLGTPAYMSPEQARGELADERSDVWSFGILAYEMLTGRLPQPRPGSLARWVRRWTDRFGIGGRVGRGTPRALARILDKCLDPDPDARYQSAEALVEELGRVRAPAPRVSATERPLLYALAAILGVLVLYWIATEL